MDNHLVALATALVVACLSCGGDTGDHLSRTPAGKGAEAAPGGEHAVTVSVPRGAPGATRPARAEDLALTASCPARVDALEDDHRIEFELRNTSESPVSLGSLRLHASIYQGEVLMPGCGDDPPVLVDGAPHVLAPGATMQLSQPMPCGIDEPGAYQVAAVVLIGAPPGSRAMETTLRVHRSFTMPLTIEARAR